MLKGKHVVFIGGDARQLEVIKNCIEGKARVSLIGFDNLQSPFSGAVNRELTENLLKTTDILILPILGTDEEGFVDSIFTTKKLVLTERHIASLPHHVTIFSGIAKSYLKDLSEKYSIRLVELLKRDDVAIYNSIPTVEGALMMAIQNTNITIHGSTCAVLGLGRVGMTLGRTLTALGAQVKMGVHRPDQAARAEEMGLKAFFTKDIHDQVDDVELLFNTVPSLIVTEEVLNRMSHNTVIIDLASKPGGVDFLHAEKRGIKALLAPSLPGIVASKSAGRILAQTIIRLVAEQHEEGSNR
ncbi:MAG: dipicolinate synthase subunit DpsA [Firmicutes bacterium]|uniref:dipicolinate synthase subunit DpsA n=1 Tax=Melghirimyces thermohalophilus TaxID=1236220 RepID=UPI000B846E07|nr:dipicolinate synthase subunit DpsA [Melghirimyces thermohalophilus]MDA8352363.1 dipicolinate synthase subunit DpsA [Bacillota bacterium]